MKYIKLIVLVFSLSIFASGDDHHDNHHEDHHEEHNGEHKGEHGEHHDDHDDHDDHHGHGNEKSGKNKAITEIDEHLGLKLSPQATARLKIKTIPFSYNLSDLNKSSYVIIGKERALYRKRNGFYKLIDEHDFSTAFKPSDEIVIEGIELLRISDIFSTDKSEYGHAH
ncbi:putative lipoprotein [Halobacteriovorax sp. BALOs_7]|uniref:hypothetical protein n=1 Tax=Halobacteriovorax sp. BALOs_7 TaxID=2109558 RepID=UPI000EA2CFCD|nr:hypothetical protein [Halobacteriovorax sp. BALOs_7]AYF44038.1 putative lipoprotein [Halobacteriovorax sp. BALOs_7]